MEHIFKYAILKAVPDPRRGERVNIGIVVFGKDQLDIRFSDMSKLRVIAGGDWVEYVQGATRHLNDIYSSGQDPVDVVAKFSLIERVIQFSEIAWFSISDPKQYEVRVESILDALVNRPKAEAGRPKSTRINTEIAQEFRKAKILAGPDEGVGDHKVVRDYYVSKPEELKADFLFKNGVYHVTATLDLRRTAVDLGHAALKAVVLDKAAEVFKKGTKRFAVYAAPPDATHFKPHIQLLQDYSDRAFNWSKTDDRRAYTRAIYSALRIPGGLDLR